MEISSVLLGVLLLLLFVAPMFYLAINQSAREKKSIKQLSLLSKKNQISLDETEYLSPVALGLDKVSKKLAVIRQVKPKKEFSLDLKEFQSCSLQKLNAERTPSETLDEVEEIHLLLKRASGAEESILFYHDDHDSVAEREARLSTAIKWQSLISDSLKE